jgi:hypothetical protein
MSTTITGAGRSAQAAHYNTIAATRSQRTDPMKSVAETLGMTTDELKDQLRSGKSLVEVATGRNLDHDRLIAAIKEGLPKNDVADATRVAEEVATAKGLPAGPPQGSGRPSGPGGPPPGGTRGQVAGLGDAAKADRLGDLLEVDAGELTSKVANAKELIELMRDKGVDLGRLRSILSSGDLVDVSM